MLNVKYKMIIIKAKTKKQKKKDKICYITFLNFINLKFYFH